jgi:membrane protein implicated in regulation of membrane protease activity
MPRWRAVRINERPQIVSREKLSYVVQCSLGMLLWVMLTAVVSYKVGQATQLGWQTQCSIWAFLWGLVIYFIWVLVRGYGRLGSDAS